MTFGQGAIAGWLTEPAGALVQFLEHTKATAEMASWLTGTAFEVLDARFPNRSDLLLVLDLQAMVGRSAASRAILLKAARANGRRFAQVLVVPPAEYPPMYLQAFHVALAIARGLGNRVELAQSSAAAIDRLKLRPTT